MYFSIDKDCPHSSATSLNNNFEVDEGDANTADSGQIFPGGCLDGLNLEATKGLVASCTDGHCAGKRSPEACKTCSWSHVLPVSPLQACKGEAQCWMFH
eukprot:CAMPEP_0169071854 /NCGR_PEP_ID=MMETSP1015-20121227/5876_1 /TAXON_ID=342587 /ORGANISM="Karlodinium micrum, Strain CCMP2283" /LENGTH=98 /DNA_ID=CAMNT_0009130957 /DNA_START=365 /DNA_END=661 /DNA_ORIENTATION=-